MTRNFKIAAAILSGIILAGCPTKEVRAQTVGNAPSTSSPGSVGPGMQPPNLQNPGIMAPGTATPGYDPQFPNDAINPGLNNGKTGTPGSERYLPRGVLPDSPAGTGALPGYEPNPASSPQP